MSRPQRKLNAEAQYCVRKRGEETVPYFTNQRGVLELLQLCKVPSTLIGDFIASIETGASYEAPKGNSINLVSIHRIMPELIDQVYAVAKTIKHDGKFGVCWFHKNRKEVWWVYSDNDEKSTTATSLEKIWCSFKAIKGITKVHINKHGQPDNRRDAGWVQVFPV